MHNSGVIDTFPTLRTLTSAGLPVVLRVPVAADVEHIVVACTDPETRAWTMIPLDFDRDRASAFVANAGGWWERGEGVRWVVADGDDQCVGLLDLRKRANDPQVGDVFFISAPPARGRGYMSAALRLAAGWSLRDHGLARVEWQALVGNDASRRVCEKAGFRPEGILRQACNQRGVRFDSWVASMVRADLGPNAPKMY
jgi:RimJ/RimL family protein N-acetyltransferase